MILVKVEKVVGSGDFERRCRQAQKRILACMRHLKRHSDDVGGTEGLVGPKGVHRWWLIANQRWSEIEPVGGGRRVMSMVHEERGEMGFGLPGVERGS